MAVQTHLRLVMLESSAIQLADPYREGGSEAKILYPLRSFFMACAVGMILCRQLLACIE
jgi:hypothetical protein